MSEQETAAHVLRVEIDGDSLRCRVECHASEGADCRLECAEHCGAETYPCYSYDDDDLGNERKHELQDSGYCNVVEWLNADSPEEAHQRLTEPVFDGMPIVTEWEGDYYSWRGVNAVPSASSSSVVSDG